MWPELKEQLEVEQAQLRKLFEIHRPLLERCRVQEPDVIELSALGAFLHGRAARLWVEAHGGADRGLFARELADSVPRALASLLRG